MCSPLRRHIGTPSRTHPRYHVGMLPFLLAAHFSATANAQSTEPVLQPGWVVDRFDLEDGLPDLHPNGLVQDRTGAIWVSSLEGPVRIEKDQLEIVPHDDLGVSRTEDVRLAQDGSVWVSLNMGGIARFEDPGWTLYPHLRINGDLLPYAFDDRHIYRLDEQPHPILTFDVPFDQATSFMRDADGGWWVHGSHPDFDLLHVHPDGRQVRLEASPDPHRNLHRISVDPQGRVWAHSSPSRQIVDDRVVPCEPCIEQPIEPRIISATDDLSWQGRTLFIDDVPLWDAEVSINRVLQDDAGHIWATTRGQGLVRLRRVPLFNLRAAAPHQVVAKVHITTAGDLWGLDNRHGWYDFTHDRPGIPWEDLPPEEARRFPPLAGTLYTLVAARVDDIPVEDNHYDLSLGGPNVGWDPFTHPATGPARWVGGSRGLFQKQPDGWDHASTKDGPLLPPRDVEEHEDGHITVGDFGIAWQLPDGSWHVPAWSRELGVVRDLFRDGDDVWIVTEEDGLCVSAGHPGRGAPRCLRAGLPSSGGHGLVPDDRGRLWFPNNAGLAVGSLEHFRAYARGQRDDIPLLLLGQRDGASNAELNGGNRYSWARGTDGRLWFASQDGLIGVDPATFELPTAHVDLAWKSDTLPFMGAWRIEAPRNRDQVQIQYRIGDGPWTRAQGDLHLDSLPPGATTVAWRWRLGGEWSEPSSSTVHRPPVGWERQELRLLAIVALAGVMALILRLVRRAARRREETLEALVEERTQALQHSRDTVAEQARRLQAQSRARDHFITQVAQELRAPLKVAAATLHDNSPRSRAFLIRSLEQLSDLVDQLFDTARADLGRLGFQATQGDLAALLRVLSEQTSLATGVEIEVDASLTPAVYDGDLMARALTHLLDNATRFSPEDRPVRVLLRTEDGHAHIEVVDEGPGIAPEDRERVFERYVQLQDHPKGTGIGLAFARQVVQLHGGRISVQDSAFGTRVVVDLPLAPPQPRRDAAAPGQGRRGGAHV